MVYNRAAAAFASATLKDHEIIPAKKNTYVINHSKLWREHTKYQEKLQEKDQKFELVNGICIDGKKDATLTVTEINGKYYKNTTMEKHFVVALEAGSSISPM